MYRIDSDLVESVLYKIKRVKAAGLDDLMVEHVLYSRPVLNVILAKLFNLIFSAAYAPYGFGLSFSQLSVRYPSQRKHRILRVTLLRITGQFLLVLYCRQSSNVVFQYSTENFWIPVPTSSVFLKF